MVVRVTDSLGYHVLLTLPINEAGFPWLYPPLANTFEGRTDEL